MTEIESIQAIMDDKGIVHKRKKRSASFRKDTLVLIETKCRVKKCFSETDKETDPILTDRHFALKMLVDEVKEVLKDR
jgi:hypothetical protein